MADGVLAVPLPHMGVSVEEATVIAWHKAVGDRVAADEPLCDIATDKVDTEVASPASGVLARIVAGVGATVAVGATLAELAVASSAEDAPPARGFDPGGAATSVVERAGNGPVSSPVARRLADEHGVDLGAVAGSGLRGRIRKADVLAAIETAPEVGLPRGYDDVPHEIVTTSRQRRLIAEHMIRSRQTAAHMTTEAEVDMTLAARARTERGVSYLALIAKATCVALAEFPDLNATFQTERLIRWSEINLGIAVDTELGLIVPVIRGCERLTAPAIAEAIADLAARARNRTLMADDVRGGTFTISNPGSVGAHSAMAIINQPQVGILGTPLIVRRPAVVVDADGREAIGIRPMMMLALTFDHRAVDGAYATRCVVRIKQLLESWDAAAYG
jgi:2-oxoglutarate dehydrogenase E2 component (dihydrolipoamide succinyltransferase)